MARGKKTAKELTPEEKLAQALVPIEEQPYQIPENWCWVRLGSISACQYGYTAKAFYGEGFPKMLRITDIQENSVDWEKIPNCKITEEELEKYLLKPKDIVIARTGATTGKSYCILNPVTAVFASYLIRLRVSQSISISFVYKFLQSDTYWKQISGLSSGIAQPGVNSTKLKNMSFPLPPLEEQQRIVERIESILAKLDEAKEKAQEVVDGFEMRKSVILHKAFTGELTKKWREEQGVTLESWKKKQLKDCGKWTGGGTPNTSRPEYWDDGGILWISAKDMKLDEIEDTQLHITDLGVENSSANYIAEASVVIVMRSGILRRTFPVAMVKRPFTVNQDLKALSPIDSLSLEYFFWACKNAEKRILDGCMKSGTTVESINAKALMNFEIPIATYEEQQEIVDCINCLLMKEKKAKQSAEAVIEQIDVMKKAVLARAFRGELGTNDPEEESAMELLKSVINL